MPFVAGSSGVALRRVLPLSVVSAVAWTALYAGIGYGLSETVGDAVTKAGLALVLIGAAAIVIRSRLPRASGSAAVAGPAA